MYILSVSFMAVRQANFSSAEKHAYMHLFGFAPRGYSSLLEQRLLAIACLCTTLVAY